MGRTWIVKGTPAFARASMVEEGLGLTSTVDPIVMVLEYGGDDDGGGGSGPDDDVDGVVVLIEDIAESVHMLCVRKMVVSWLSALRIKSAPSKSWRAEGLCIL
jgi:hypothetical protein